MKRVLRGEQLQIAAGDWNRFCTATEWVERQMTSGPGPLGIGITPVTQCLIRNDTGAALLPGHIVQFEAVTAATRDYEFDRAPVIGVDAPFDRSGEILVCLDGIPVDGIGYAATAGMVRVQVDIHTGSSVRVGDYVEAIPGSVAAVRKSAIGAARLLWYAPTGATGATREALILLAHSNPGGFYGVLGTQTGSTYAIVGRAGSARDVKGATFAELVGMTVYLTPDPANRGSFLFGPYIRVVKDIVCGANGVGQTITYALVIGGP